mgnify:CR=1 FL=1
MNARDEFINSFRVSINKSTITVLLIFIQSCGVQYIPKQGSILLVLILVLTRDGLLKLTNRDVRNLTIMISFLILNKLINESFETSMLLYQSALVIEAYVFLVTYRTRSISALQQDVSEALKIIFVHAMIGFVLYHTMPFMFQTATSGYRYKSFLGFFYVSYNDSGLIRNTGMMWEPGLLQLMLNFLLFFLIIKDKSKLFMVLVAVGVLTTYSTTGYICLFINYLIFIVVNFKTRRRFVTYLVIITLLSSSLFYFMLANIEDKLGGENLSGLARYRDFYIGLELIKEKPILGHGLFNESYLFTKEYVSVIEMNLFKPEDLEIIGSIAGGYVNGLFAIFAWFGIPASLTLFVLFFRNKIFDGSYLVRILFFLIMCFTFLAEPITYTSFFLIFPFSTLVFRKRYIQIYE